jgi:shikimate dehydrogenase
LRTLTQQEFQSDENENVPQATQEILCCMGCPVAGNPTQYVVEKALAAAGLDWRYLTLEVPPERLGDAVRGMKAMGLRGGHFAAPHKQPAIEFVDELTDSAKKIGAINCVELLDGRLIGDNAEGRGFVEALRRVAEPEGMAVVVVGAGSVATAIAVELALAGAAKFIIANRDARNGAVLVELLSRDLKVEAVRAELDRPLKIDAGASLVVHATSIGQSGDDAIELIDLDTLDEKMIFADAAYNPPATALLEAAKERGLKTIHPVATFVAQVSLALRRWTGIEPDADVMREALEEFLGL